ncbi:CRISPR-associated RAMP Cmr1 [Methanosarcina siciliae C2J]|uniref:CRISPR-associated RAMP Cmr1 n=1 Tax=Methanosarcina siciliae C2J TaxID=1434118 RepID=A0A0E3PQH6_9EURY|nr:type III-B CRISPR module RAMP protein Cmr1 [Methanosarcina siciliae]AKB36822.1 CRISPR-associated RAMP Cmr1 [Methanosarcina siciliae C2J]
MTVDVVTYQFQALTDIWTGSVQLIEKNGEPKEKIVQDHLIQTSLLGSIRWWFEIVVRGLGGNACDPSKSKCEDTKHCIACELFGCTGWARKFRFQVLDNNEDISGLQIKRNIKFRLQFTPLRPIRDEEWALLDLTLRIISEYGALGGKTVFKPSDENGRKNKLHHHDFGITKLLSVEPQIKNLKKDILENYVLDDRWCDVKEDGFEWASFNNFWAVNGKYLSRQGMNKSTFNNVVGRKEPKNQSKFIQNSADRFDKWLSGGQQESKKVFSFKNPPRTFGFVKQNNVKQFDEMRRRLGSAWPYMSKAEFMIGSEILNKLLAKEGDL